MRNSRLIIKIMEAVKFVFTMPKESEIALLHYVRSNAVVS